MCDHTMLSASLLFTALDVNAMHKICILDCEDVMCEDAMCEDAMCEDAMCEDRVFLCLCANMDDKIWALIPCAWLSLTMNNC